MRSSIGLSTLVLTAGLVLSPPAANAQNQPPSSSPPAATAPGTANPSADVSDKKLDAAAAAVKGVAAVKESYQQKLAATPGKEEKERIADEAQSAMVKAVTDQGLSVEEYTAILQVAQNNPAVHDKILQRLK